MDTKQLHVLIDRLAEIGCALSSERDLNVLLSAIVNEARRLTSADGGTLFLLDESRQTLRWAIVQNTSMSLNKGGAGASPLEGSAFNPIPLYAEDAPILSNVAAYVAHRAEVVNISDVYSADDSWDFEGPRRFDTSTGYRTRSLLVVPLQHFEGGVIGVLQLINAINPESGETWAFAPSFERLTVSLASQAAVALKNAELFAELELQFESFIRSIAMTIDEKSAYTAGHVRRVVDLTMRISRALDSTSDGLYADVRFSEDDYKAMRIAAWMHDIGKITTPEYIVDKATKLELITDRIELIRERFRRLETEAELRALKRKLNGEPQSADEALPRALEKLRSDLAFIEVCNQGSEYMRDVDIERVHSIAASGTLTAEEVTYLTIRRGTLTVAERDIIRDHARVSFKILSELPFSRHLVDVPEIAASHHEKLNGTGYPRGLSADQLPLKSRVLAVADIFEALTAADRPYKNPTPLSGVLRILGFMVRDGELDPDLVNFALRSGVLDEYTRCEVDAKQRDVLLSDHALLTKPGS